MRRVRDRLLQSKHGDADVAETSREQELLDRIDLMAGERHVVELRRIGGKEPPRDLVHDAAERVVAVGVPDAEQIAAAGSENAENFGEGFGLVGKEHDSELAHRGVEARNPRREAPWRRRAVTQCCSPAPNLARAISSIGGLRSVAVRSRAGRQCVAQFSRDDAGAGRCLQHPRRIAGGDAPGDVGGVIGEDDRPEALIVELRNAANETRGVVAHDAPPITRGGARRRPPVSARA